MQNNPDLKSRTARAMKWNIIDRFGSQLLYAVTGIVLARELSQEEFGLVGAVLVFQAFALLLIDSGFSYALIQRKEPTKLDYSTVLWFNMGMAAVLYIILWPCAPLIADCFGGDPRLIPLSRVMFITLLVNASSIVQANRLTKRLEMRPVAIANAVGLAAGAVVGIWLAVSGFGAWAIVWQTITSGAVKSLYLWLSERWLPLFEFSWKSLRSFTGVGLNMMFTSFLNTLFLNIYSFFIGNRVGLVSLGYYTQSDKWSKMGIATTSQVLTSTFLPVLSSMQDDMERFRRAVAKMNRTTAYVIFPLLFGLMVTATPIFHVLFGTKWDPSIILFRLLLLRGVFTVMISLYNNYMIALGRARAVVGMEVLRDSCAIVALIITMPYMALTLPDDPVYGITIMLWGQLAASVITWVATLWCASRITGRSVAGMLADLAPYAALTALIVPLMIAGGTCFASDWLTLAVELIIGAGCYVGANRLLRSRVQQDVFTFVRGGKFSAE